MITFFIIYHIVLFIIIGFFAIKATFADNPLESLGYYGLLLEVINIATR